MVGSHSFCNSTLPGVQGYNDGFTASSSLSITAELSPETVDPDQFREEDKQPVTEASFKVLDRFRAAAYCCAMCACCCSLYGSCTRLGCDLHAYAVCQPPCDICRRGWGHMGCSCWSGM